MPQDFKCPACKNKKSGSKRAKKAQRAALAAKREAGSKSVIIPAKKLAAPLDLLLSAAVDSSRRKIHNPREDTVKEKEKDKEKDEEMDKNDDVVRIKEAGRDIERQARSPQHSNAVTEVTSKKAVVKDGYIYLCEAFASAEREEMTIKMVRKPRNLLRSIAPGLTLANSRYGLPSLTD